jgi:hypothetical protein
MIEISPEFKETAPPFAVYRRREKGICLEEQGAINPMTTNGDKGAIARQRNGHFPRTVDSGTTNPRSLPLVVVSSMATAVVGGAAILRRNPGGLYFYHHSF